MALCRDPRSPTHMSFGQVKALFDGKKYLWMGGARVNDEEQKYGLPKS